MCNAVLPNPGYVQASLQLQQTTLQVLSSCSSHCTADLNVVETSCKLPDQTQLHLRSWVDRITVISTIVI